MLKLAIVVGTRPEAIKLIPVYKTLTSKHPEIIVDLISTGQHKEMLQQVFDLFDVTPQVELDVMRPNQSINSLLSKVIEALNGLFTERAYDAVFVQGDTTTAFAGAMTAYYLKTPVFHVEAGLRSHDMNHPFPEEANRKLIGVIANLNFVPTEKARQNLLNENYDDTSIHIVGNTVVDSLLLILDRVQKEKHKYASSFAEIVSTERAFILITGHRRESFGSGFENICDAITKAALNFPEIDFVYPVHLNPNVQDIVHQKLGAIENIKLIQPVPYDQMVYLMHQSLFILTDSGGIQEEAPSLNKAVIVMRKTTERKEGVDAGCAILVGTDQQTIFDRVNELIIDKNRRATMEAIKNPYGDGNASERIIEIALKTLK